MSNIPDLFFNVGAFVWQITINRRDEDFVFDCKPCRVFQYRGFTGNKNTEAIVHIILSDIFRKQERRDELQRVSHLIQGG
jgi:hypothetical protein